MVAIRHVVVVIAAVVFFVLGAAWYTLLSEHWLAGIGKSMADVERDTGGGASSYLIGFVAILVMCYALAWLIARLDRRTMMEGAATGACVALGFVAAMLALNYAFEGRGIELWLINAGYALVGLVVAGAIIGRYPAAAVR